MELHRTQILLEKTQHERLTEIAREESRSLSEIVREMITRELRYRQRHQILMAARELQADYETNLELSEFSALDGEDYLFDGEADEEG